MKTLVTTLAMLVLGIGIGACFGGGSERSRPAGSAIWTDSQAVEITTSDLVTLNRVGIGEVWFDAASIVDAAGGVELRPVEDPQLVPRTPVTLVIRGRWPGSDKVEALAEEVRRLIITYEGRGWIPLGVHLAIDVANQEDLFEDLEQLRDQLESSSIYLSLQLPRDVLAEESWAELGEAVDFVVCDLYGQLPGVRESTKYWDLLEVERDVELLEALGIPYLVGVVTVGTVTWLGRDGEQKGHAMNLSLMDLVSDRSLELTHGFTLEGIDRQVYGLRVTKTMTVGSWMTRIGDRLRFVRLASHHLKELRRRLAGQELEAHLGEIYYRQRHAGETMASTAEQLAAAFGSEDPTPELVVHIEEIASRGASKKVRVVMENLNGESTDLATIEGNYLELRILGGHLKYVEQGDFYRYDLLKSADQGESFRTLNRPDVVRLYQPLIDGFGRVASGPIDIVVKGEISMEIDGRFLLPDTRTLALPVVTWP